MDPVTASLIASSVGSGIKEVGNTILGITRPRKKTILKEIVSVLAQEAHQLQPEL